MAPSQNKVVFVGVGVCVLGRPFIGPAASLYSASPLKHHPRVGSDVRTQTIILTPSYPVGL